MRGQVKTERTEGRLQSLLFQDQDRTRRGRPLDLRVVSLTPQVRNHNITLMGQSDL